jgi:hypothetical protein
MRIKGKLPFKGVNIMKFLVWFLIIVSFAGCGVSKDEYDKVLAENEQLKKEIDQFKYGKERTLALIENSYQAGDIKTARQNINILAEYHPEYLDESNVIEIVKLVETAEEIERLRIEAEQEERIRLEKLRNIGKTADNPLVISGKSGFINGVLREIILNRKDYAGKYISIDNTYYDQFGIRYSTTHAIDGKWYESN